MKNTGIAKAILGLVLVVGVIVGGMVGLDIDFNIEPMDAPEVSEGVAPEDTAPVDTVVDENVEVPDTTVETPNAPADSTEAEADVPTVDESAEQEVTQPADNT